MCVDTCGCLDLGEEGTDDGLEGVDIGGEVFIKRRFGGRGWAYGKHGGSTERGARRRGWARAGDVDRVAGSTEQISSR